MADDIYAEQTEQIVEGSIDVGDEFQKALKQHLAGVPYAMQELTDMEYIMWFDGKMQSNPNWLPALLMFVEGGEHEYQRYLKARVRLMEKMYETAEAV